MLLNTKSKNAKIPNTGGGVGIRDDHADAHMLMHVGRKNVIAPRETLNG